tara:strand:+ start:3173 stop:3838 length:666 start_codon:yes stop_codon:yes gene_type:complete
MELIKAWSYSSLTAFETCPRRFELTRVSRKVKEPATDAMNWGNEVHKALELFARDGTPLPKALEKFGRYVDKILSYEGKRVIEENIALDRSFRPTTWMANDVWVRGIIDIGVVGEDRAYLLDWKTGKRKLNSDQLMLFAALAFAQYPWVDKVTTGFIWLKTGEFDKSVFTRDQLPEIWNEFMPRLKRLAIAYDESKWNPRPSGLCKNWCPVGRQNCEFCGI